MSCFYKAHILLFFALPHQDNNFGNPMFEAYSSNSTQRLLENGGPAESLDGSVRADGTGEEEENHNMLDNLKVEYSSPGEKRNSKRKKKSQNSRTSVA